MEKLAELQVRDNVKLILSRGEYKGSERIDLRQYFLKDDEYIATKREISFDSEYLDDFLDMAETLR